MIDDICQYAYGVVLDACRFQCICRNVNSTGLDCTEQFNQSVVDVGRTLHCAERHPTNLSIFVKICYILLIPTAVFALGVVGGQITNIWEATNQQHSRPNMVNKILKLVLGRCLRLKNNQGGIMQNLPGKFKFPRKI